jgi:hypothetical protein
MATYEPTFHDAVTDTLTYAITFEYARVTDLQVLVDDVEIDLGTADDEWVPSTNGLLITFVDGFEPQTGETIEIRRITDISAPIVDWTAGSGFTEIDADLMVSQLLKAIDELQVPAFEYITTMTLATDADIQVAHNLGAAPTRIEIQLECLSTDAGWADGDFFPIYNFVGVASFDAANMNISEKIADAVRIRNKTTGALAGAPTPAKWNIVVRAWR